MGLQDKITKIDALNLKNIQRKLNLKLSDRRRIEELYATPDLSDDEKMRIFLTIPDEVSTSDYLRAKLNESEINTMNKFLKKGLL